MKTIVTDNDFFTALLCGLASRQRRTLSLEGDYFNKAVVKAYEELKGHEEELCLELRFSIYLNAIYSDSSVITSGILRAAGRNLCSFDWPTMQFIRINISPEVGAALLKTIPFPEVTMKMTQEFIEEYEGWNKAH